MIKPTVREPIHLAKLKKKSKVEEIIGENLIESKNSIDYDIQIFQESLNIHTESNRQEPSLSQKQLEQSLNLKQNEGIDTNSTFKRSLKLTNDMKNHHDRPFNQPIPTNFTSNENNIYSSIHKAKICFKPNTSQVENKENKSAHIAQPKPRSISTVNALKTEVLKEIKNANQINTALDKSKQNEISAMKEMKEAYEQTIKELMTKNEEAYRKIENLEHRLKEKEEMAVRVDQIQQDLNLLYEQNRQLLRIKESLSKLSLHSEENRTDMLIQTDVFPLYVNDSFCQTIPEELELLDLRASADFQQQDLLKKAKIWRFQLECERIAAINKQTQFRVAFQNSQIKHRQQVDILQKQIEALSINFEHKCQEVKEKDSIISKFLLKKQ